MTHEPTSADQRVLGALLLLLSDVAITRFDLLVMSREPLEAAQEVIASLDRYDFLRGLTSEAHYTELKKQLESRISDRADRVIREQNPR